MNNSNLNSNEYFPTVDKSIDDLVQALKENNNSNFTSIITSTYLSIHTLEEYSSWSDECYTRNCIEENEKFELILLCWEKGQQTPIHDHGGEECWVKIINGEFKETIFKTTESGELEVENSFVLKEDEISYMIDFMGFHSIENISDGRSMSLHLYAKPIRNCNIFDEDLKTFEMKNLQYDTICEKLKK